MATCCGDSVFRESLDFVVGDDFSRSYEHRDWPADVVSPFPAGSFFYEFFVEPVHVKWVFVVSGSLMSLKVESEDVAKIPDRTHFHLKFLPAGELAGGSTLVAGNVRRVC